MDNEQSNFFKKIYNCVNVSHKQVDEKKSKDLTTDLKTVKNNVKDTTNISAELKVARDTILKKESFLNNDLKGKEKADEENSHQTDNESLAKVFGRPRLYKKRQITPTLQKYDFRWSELKTNCSLRGQWCTPNCDCDMCRRISYRDRQCDYLIYQHDGNGDEPPNLEHA